MSIWAIKTDMTSLVVIKEVILTGSSGGSLTRLKQREKDRVSLAATDDGRVGTQNAAVAVKL
jgi:hypothetical protein